MLPPTFVPGFHDEEAVRAMPYTALGATGLTVSKLALGGGAFAPVYGNFSEEEAIATIRESLKQGINYIDTGPWYGQGQSEEILGKALKSIPRQAYYIGTKVGRYETDPHKMFDFTAEKTVSSVNTSLQKLGLDYVDVIQVHDVEFAPSIDVVLNQTLPTLKLVVQAGQARHIGITGYPVSVLKEVVERSTVPIATVLSYSRCTLIDNTLQQYIRYFQSKNLGIICAAAVAMGLLTNAGPQPWHPAPADLKDICSAAAEFCKERGVELGKLAMYHSLKQQGPHTHLVGMNCRKILGYNLEVLRTGLTSLEEETLDLVSAKYLSTVKQGHWEGIELAQYKKAVGSK